MSLDRTTDTTPCNAEVLLGGVTVAEEVQADFSLTFRIQPPVRPAPIVLPSLSTAHVPSICFGLALF